MATYVALLRGIMPQNPNMHGSKLKGVFESLGFTNVVTVIGSGNVVFETKSKNVKALEAKIQAELPKQLGFSSTTIIKSKDELEKLIKKNPFKGVKDERPNYLVVTFFKQKPNKTLCTVINLSASKTPDFMRKVEKEHGKEITTRTWKTIGKIVKKMESRK
jgi:uncharacterized protein (DUF1697 family)